MIVVEIAGQILLWLVLAVGILIIPVGLPGTFLIVVSAFIYALLTHFAAITWTVLVALLVIAILAEIVELLFGAAAARQFGAGKQAIAGAIVGGFIGAIWATPLFPFFGTLFGALIGAFAGAALFEYLGSSDLRKSLRVGTGAFLGALGGKLTKIAAACGMVVMIGYHLYL